jgi:hypothetical protein
MATHRFQIRGPQSEAVLRKVWMTPILPRDGSFRSRDGVIALNVLRSEIVRLCGVGRDLKPVFFRYREHLRPNIVREPWRKDEDLAILYGQHTLGNRWAEM